MLFSDSVSGCRVCPAGSPRASTQGKLEREDVSGRSGGVHNAFSLAPGRVAARYDGST